jgi:hypothetical protein
MIYGIFYIPPVKPKNLFFKSSWLNIWVSNKHGFPVGPAKGPADLFLNEPDRME